MIMPSMVSAVRILLRLSAFTAMRRIMMNDIGAPRYADASAGCGSAASSASATRRRATALSAIT